MSWFATVGSGARLTGCIARCWRSTPGCGERHRNRRETSVKLLLSGRVEISNSERNAKGNEIPSYPDTRGREILVRRYRNIIFLNVGYGTIATSAASGPPEGRYTEPHRCAGRGAAAA